METLLAVTCLLAALGHVVTITLLVRHGLRREAPAPRAPDAAVQEWGATYQKPEGR